MIYGHGDDIHGSQREVKANFSTNVWYGADPVFIRRLVAECAETVMHYPEPAAVSFCEAVAAYHGVTTRQVMAGNGATELFYLIAHAFAGNRTALFVPSFREYEDACVLYGHDLSFFRRQEERKIPEDIRLMFICNPNNPDGKMWAEREIRDLLEGNPEMTLVVDESFIRFAPSVRTACRLLPDYPNLLVVRSMTKDYAIPGLRLGYMLGDAGLLGNIARYRQPWSVNALAIEVGKRLLQEERILPDAVALLERQKYFSARIAEIPGFRPLPSETSFFLVESDYSAPELKATLLEREGLLIRDASNFRGLDRHYFRINTLTEEKNRWLLNALKTYAK